MIGWLAEASAMCAGSGVGGDRLACGRAQPGAEKSSQQGCGWRHAYRQLSGKAMTAACALCNVLHDGEKTHPAQILPKEAVGFI